jgi:hypothetical protein
MKLRFMLPLSLVLLLLMAACAPAPELRNDAFLSDVSLLSGDPCEAPCWNGITPGETDWREAIITIEDDPELTNPEEVQAQESDARLVRFNHQDGPECCRLYSEEGETVSDILLLLAPEMRFGAVVERYGEPTYVLIGDEGADVTPDQAVLSMVYPDIPMIVYVFAAGTENGEVTVDSEVIGSIYMTESNMEIVTTQRNLYNWEGFMPVSDILDGNFDVIAEPTAPVEE